MKNIPTEFVVTNDPDLDYDLIQEAWIQNEQVADVRHVNNVWKVTFFSQEGQRELSWDVLQKIYSVFFKFIQESDAIKATEHVM